MDWHVCQKLSRPSLIAVWSGRDLCQLFFSVKVLPSFVTHSSSEHRECFFSCTSPSQRGSKMLSTWKNKHTACLKWVTIQHNTWFLPFLKRSARCVFTPATNPWSRDWVGEDLSTFGKESKQTWKNVKRALAAKWEQEPAGRGEQLPVKPCGTTRVTWAGCGWLLRVRPFVALRGMLQPTCVVGALQNSAWIPQNAKC